MQYRKSLTYRNSFQYRVKGIAPSGFDASSFGTSTLSRSITPSGFSAFGTGTGAIWNSRQFVSPTAITPVGFGGALVWNYNQYVVGASVNADALHPTAFGAAWISLFLRRLSTVGAGDTSLFGQPFVSASIRYLDLAGRGPDTSAFGTQFVAYRVRQVYPLGYFNTAFGGTLVDFNHTVVPQGIYAGDPLDVRTGGFGIADVHVPRQYVDLTNQGIAGAFGTARIDNHIQYVRPPGFLPAPTLQEQFGQGVVDLWTKYIEQLFEPAPNDGGVFGNPIDTLVENRNKVIATHGADWAPLTRFGTAYVYNNARLVYGEPFVDFSLWGDTLVAYRVRTVSTIGVDTSEWGRPLDTIIYNAARVLAPAGWNSSAVGAPQRVWSNLQTVHVVGADQSVFGTPMVAFRVRTIAPYSLPDPPPFGDAHTQLWVRTLQPAGIDAGGRGVPTLEIHFNVIGAKSILPPSNAFGTGRVWNLTPELGTLGYEQTLWGRPAVYNQFERYTLTGFNAVLWGNAKVADRRQWIAPTSAISLAMGPYNTVRNVLPDPPAQQTIAEDWSTSPPLTTFGRPTVYLATIYPEGDVLTTWGRPTVIYMGFMPASILPPADPVTNSQFGVPFLAPPQYIFPTWTTPPDRDPAQYGIAQMWPHVIWAPRGYPYPENEANLVHEEYIDHRFAGDIDNGARPFFGSAEVTLSRRTIFEYHDDRDHFFSAGTPSVALGTQYIYPNGLRSQKFGIPVLWGGNHALQVYYGPETLEFGSTTVAYAPVLGPQTVYPSGFVAFTAGTAYVDYFNRTLHASGWNSFTTSTTYGYLPPEWSDVTNLITWVSNQYPPVLAHGFDASLFGTTWVSFRIRSIYPEGDDTSIVADYTPGYFADRMRVWKRSYVVPAGIGPLGFGQAWVSLGSRIVRPYASPVGRPGQPQVRNINAVAPGGWDSETFGDVQRWEAGKIKPHGDDLALWGKAIINRALHTQGFAGDLGMPSVSHSFAAEGFDDSGLGVPTAIARWCGNKAMAVAGFDDEQFGMAGVTHG